MTGSPEDKRKQALEGVQEVLSDMEPADRLPFLAYAEQRARQDSDLVRLRAIRDYRAMMSKASTEPPESA